MLRANDIERDQFRRYPPEARRLAEEHAALLGKLPVILAQLLLEQIKQYDWRFPAERLDITRQLTFLEQLEDGKRRELVGGFERLKLSDELVKDREAEAPGEFSERLSGYLWATHQIDAFHELSANYLATYREAMPEPERAAHRLGIAIIGKGVETSHYPLFRKFRRYGTRFTNVEPGNGLRILLEGAAARAQAHREAFAHWYVDGGVSEPIPEASLWKVSYGDLEPARKALLGKIAKARRTSVSGPEGMLTLLHRMGPEEIGLPTTPALAVLSRFQMNLLTSGSGTQIYSTTFVQWAARELWRRAQPLTLLARFAPRQRERPMNELLDGDEATPRLDPAGSLIDGDMGAFYMWLEQQRLTGAKEASFLVWFEGHAEALVVSPGLPANTESGQRVDLKWLLGQVS